MINPAIYRYCKYQERCHSEVRSKLIELEIYGAALEEQIALLIEANTINEERYARAYVRGHFRIKRWGRKKIVQQLKIKKVSDYCIKKGLSEIDGAEYIDTLQKICAKKVAELAKERNIFIRKAKLQRFLLQKGYEQDLIKDAIDTLYNNFSINNKYTIN